MTVRQWQRPGALLQRGAVPAALLIERWTRGRIGRASQRTCHVEYHPCPLAPALHAHGVTVQRLAPRAAERDEDPGHAWLTQDRPAATGDLSPGTHDRLRGRGRSHAPDAEVCPTAVVTNTDDTESGGAPHLPLAPHALVMRIHDESRIPFAAGGACARQRDSRRASE